MNKANTVYTAKDLEEAFEWYYNEILIREYNGPSRHYKPGRVYGFDGTYGDQEKEDQYQIWVNDTQLVERTVEEYFYYKDYHGEPAKDAFYDSLQGSEAAFGAAIGAEVEEQAESEQEKDDVEEELFEIDIDDITYCTNDENNGSIYELKDGDVGDKVGYFKEGEPFFYADEN
jgi:hypothetical protein